jgi:hypothetical protein
VGILVSSKGPIFRLALLQLHLFDFSLLNSDFLLFLFFENVSAYRSNQEMSTNARPPCIIHRKKKLEQGLSLQAPPGSYKLRLVLEELMNGRKAALSRPVEIR